jgi:DNA topoisomerase-1
MAADRPSFCFYFFLCQVPARAAVTKHSLKGTTITRRNLNREPFYSSGSYGILLFQVPVQVGAEKNKLRATALGKSVIAYLVREYADLFNYSFTATMEQGLDEIAKANRPWKSLLQDTWDTYKERYLTHTTGGVNKAAKERQLSPEIKVILSRKGPLFVKEAVPPEKKATFAPLPSNVSFESATLADAQTAFIQASTAKQGEHIGMLETEEIRKKKGPYGLYAECKGIRIPLKGEETIEQIQEKLIAKISFQTSETAFSRTVGEFTIKKGPYGLYFYKHTLKRVSFVKFPTALDAEKVNAVDLQALYSAGLAKKRKPFPKKKEDA